MPSLEERDGKIGEEMAEEMLAKERNLWPRPPERAEHRDELDQLRRRLEGLRTEENVLAKSRQLSMSPETLLRVAAVKLGITEDPVRSPIYRDDLAHR